jgi:uncharacterized protein (TIGR00730 family)
MNKRLVRICVFCGSSPGGRPEYSAAASALGQAMAARDIGLVFGGGRVGLMGVVANAILAAGGHAIGVIPNFMIDRELAHEGLPDLRVVSSMHERKALMASLADAFIALPGGFGTFEELCEAVTWTQLGLHRKRCGLLNVRGFYDPMLALFDRAVDEGFVRDETRQILVARETPGALLDALANPPDAPEPRWLRSPQQT